MPLRLRAAALAVLLVACARDGSIDSSDPPRRRDAGPRWVAFSGADPALRGWTKVDGTLWIEEAHAEPFRRGYLFDGTGYVSFAQADANATSAEHGHVLRTDHVLLRTDAPFEEARRLAMACEQHAERLFRVFGEPLDLRVPVDPLPVLVAAKRSEFSGWLRDKVSKPVEWGAFYHAATGRVFASAERREKGGLSVVADLRHEMTHAILDRGSKDGVPAETFSRPNFWIWEGAAVWAEGLGDPVNAREGAERFERFGRRLAWNDIVPLEAVVRLKQEEFIGRHYDEVASFMRWLMDGDRGKRRPAALSLLALVMTGRAEERDFDRLLGLSPTAAQSAWLAGLSK